MLLKILSYLIKYKIPFILFFVIFLGYLANFPIDYSKDYKNGLVRRLAVTEDLVPNTFLPYVILKHKTIVFNPIIKDIRPYLGGRDTEPYYVILHNEKYISSYPILTGIMSIPFYIIPIMLNKIPNVFEHFNVLKILAIGRVVASFYTAISCVVMYLILKSLSDKKDKVWSIIFSIFYAFGTSSWTVSSRGLWTHTLSQLFISLSFLFLIYGLKKEKYIKWVGLFLGLAVLTRPTNIVFAVIFSLYVFFNKRKQFFKYVLLALPTIIFYLAYNYFTFGSFLTDGYSARGDHNWSTSWLVSIPALLFSFDRSFLFLSPPLVLSFFAMFKYIKKAIERKIKKTDLDVLFTYSSICFIVFFLMITKWWGWAGASAFGYRMLTETLPIVTALSFLISKEFSKLGKTILIILMVYSVCIHFNAVIFRKSRCSEDHLWTTYCLMPPTKELQY